MSCTWRSRRSCWATGSGCSTISATRPAAMNASSSSAHPPRCTCAWRERRTCPPPDPQGSCDGDSAVGAHGVEALVRALKMVNGGEVARALLTSTEGFGELGSCAGPVQGSDLGGDVVDLEVAGLEQRERRDQPGEVVLEPGRARQHRLEGHLAGRHGFVTGEDMTEVVGD